MGIAVLIAILFAVCLFFTYVSIKNTIFGFLNTPFETRFFKWENLHLFFVFLTCIFWGLFYYLTH